MIAVPTRTNLHWPVDVYRRVIKGEITQAEADLVTMFPLLDLTSLKAGLQGAATAALCSDPRHGVGCCTCESCVEVLDAARAAGVVP